MATSFSGGRSRSTRRDIWYLRNGFTDITIPSRYTISFQRWSNPALSSFMTYQRVCNKSNTTAAQWCHVEQELITLPEHLSSPSDFDGVLVSRSIAFFVVFCRSLFVCFFFSFFYLLVILLSVLLRVTVSGYSFDKFKFFFIQRGDVFFQHWNDFCVPAAFEPIIIN